jgi:hypothetical protein
MRGYRCIIRIQGYSLHPYAFMCYTENRVRYGFANYKKVNIHEEIK